MRAFVPYEEFEFEFPEDMREIVRYLKEHGELKVGEKLLEALYGQFSDEVYSAQWMDVNDQNLQHFAEWLSEIEVGGTTINHYR